MFRFSDFNKRMRNKFKSKYIFIKKACGRYHYKKNII